MLFSSNIFLFAFLPLFLATYFAARSLHWRNLVLLFFSLVFYAWGEPYFVVVLMASVVVNWLLVSPLAQRRKSALAAAIVWNLGILAVFKYADFTIANINALTGAQIPLPEIALPLGISFFSFQSVSFALDIYQGRARPERRLANVALYITMFPQLVAGPIVRFSTVANHLNRRLHTLSRASLGVRVFIVGLAQKMLIANEVGRAADVTFSLGPSLDIGEAWLGLGAYTLQIYYDFAGYSNMAIGLGLVCGFMFPRNFRLPYTALSVTEFWRRWHMSLSRWFRDYLYIPLGGNRYGKARTGFNLMTVFVLCGLWHGAALNFLVWGLHHGAFLLLERFGLRSVLAALPGLARQVYTLLAVMAGWVWFRAEDLPAALSYFAALAGAPGDGRIDPELQRAMVPYWYFAMVAGIVIAVVPARFWQTLMLGTSRAIARGIGANGVTSVNVDYFMRGTAALVLFAFSIILLGAGDYNPFLYFRF